MFAVLKFIFNFLSQALKRILDLKGDGFLDFEQFLIGIRVISFLKQNQYKISRENQMNEEDPSLIKYFSNGMMIAMGT